MANASMKSVNIFPSPSFTKHARVAFITAVYGGYEKSCKSYTRQTIPSDFICFTDNPNINSNGWIVDPYPYHEEAWNNVTDGWIDSNLEINNTKISLYEAINAYYNNKHPFKIAKFYKTSFHKIPFLLEREYEVIIWMDGTIAIQNERTAEVMLNLLRNGHNLISFERVTVGGSLIQEALSGLHQRKYFDTNWF